MAIRRLLPALVFALAVIGLTGLSRGDLVTRDAKGRLVAVPPPVADTLRNPVTPDYEDAFLDRAQVAIKQNTGKGKYGNTYFENEKGAYPPAMFDVLFGNREAGLKMLQEEDNQAGSWNKVTAGIDYYACFTIKHQMRKYFYLGQFLDPAYRQRMFDGAKLWTEKDPAGRTNPFTTQAKSEWRAKNPGQPPPFAWTPSFMNSWVDVRCTDNLRAMRETSIYLMAEETGNTAVCAQYKRTLQRYVWALWNIGMGEWDSENYHMHTFAPYLNLYDFAKDPEVKRTAKAALDMLITMGAVKYYQGGFCGPIKRDYQKPYVFGGAAGELWLYFGDTPIDNPHTHSDSIHIITSAYRPPAAVVAFARKRFAKPVEFFAAKPEYENWTVEGPGGKDGPNRSAGYPVEGYQNAPHRPWVIETTYIGDTFQLGTLPQGSFGDVNGLKLLMRDSKLGAQFFTAASGTGLSKINTGAGKDRIAHNRNIALVLTATGDADWVFLLPERAEVEDVGPVKVIKSEQTWIALRPINIEFGTPDGKPVPIKKNSWPNTQGMKAKGTGGDYSGFAMEVGDAAGYGSWSAFKRSIADGVVEPPNDSKAFVTYRGGNGISVGLGDLSEWDPAVHRNGERLIHDKTNWALWRPTDGGNAPISLGWKQGKLHVEAEGKQFDATLTTDGGYTWSKP